MKSLDELGTISLEVAGTIRGVVDDLMNEIIERDDAVKVLEDQLARAKTEAREWKGSFDAELSGRARLMKIFGAKESECFDDFMNRIDTITKRDGEDWISKMHSAEEEIEELKEQLAKLEEDYDTALAIVNKFRRVLNAAEGESLPEVGDRVLAEIASLKAQLAQQKVVEEEGTSITVIGHRSTNVLMPRDPKDCPMRSEMVAIPCCRKEGSSCKHLKALLHVVHASEPVNDYTGAIACMYKRPEEQREPIGRVMTVQGELRDGKPFTAQVHSGACPPMIVHCIGERKFCKHYAPDSLTVTSESDRAARYTGMLTCLYGSEDKASAEKRV